MLVFVRCRFIWNRSTELLAQGCQPESTPALAESAGLGIDKMTSLKAARQSETTAPVEPGHDFKRDITEKLSCRAALQKHLLLKINYGNETSHDFSTR